MVNKKAFLKSAFLERPDIFSEYCFPHYVTKETPKFHLDLYESFKDWNTRFYGIAAPRGHAKSTVITTFCVLWAILNNKAKFIVIVSDSQSQSKNFLNGIKSELEGNEKILAIYGDMTGERWGEEDIITANGIRVLALGQGQKIRGLRHRETRPDLIICDDLENDELVINDARRKKLADRFASALLPSLSDQGRVFLIGTILHFDSLLKNIIDGLYNEFKTHKYSAIEKGKALWSDHLSLNDLDRIKSDYKKRGQLNLFYAEYLNEPISSEDAVFQSEMFKYYDELPELKKITIAIDPAISQKQTADFSAISVVGIDLNNNIYNLDYTKKRMLPDEIIDEVIRLADKWKPHVIGIEGIAYQEMLYLELKKQMRLRGKFYYIEKIRNSTDKVARITATLQPRYSAGVIYHNNNSSDLEEELLVFPMGKHDDLIDAFEMAVRLLDINKQVSNPVTKMYGKNKDDSWGDMLLPIRERLTKSRN